MSGPERTVGTRGSVLNEPLIFEQGSPGDTGVHLVERSGKGRYRYLGPVDLAGDPYRRNELDADGKMRLTRVLPLRLLADPAAEAAVAESSVSEDGRSAVNL